MSTTTSRTPGAPPVPYDLIRFEGKGQGIGEAEKLEFQRL